MRIPSIWLAIVALLALTTGCATEEQRVYRGGERVFAAPLGIEEHYSFRFVDKWRISHDWLSGPLELRGCQGYLLNTFRLLGGYGPLGLERNAPLIEKNDILYFVSEHKGIFRLVSPRERIYGTNRDGEFVDFLHFCGHVFRDSMDGIGLYIVKPDPAKGTDDWIKGADRITINGLHWLRKTLPIRDWSESRGRLSAPIEIWVLKIPDTPYWLKLSFASNSGATSKYNAGAIAFPEKHQLLLELFHDIVASVRLDPIEPISIDHLNAQVIR